MKVIVEMRRAAFPMLLAFAASAATAGLPGSGTVARTTSKPSNQFAACFVQAQDRAAHAWSFVPKENGGGTFSNLGAKGVSRPYYLDVADLGSRREIRVENASADAVVMRAVDRCV